MIDLVDERNAAAAAKDGGERGSSASTRSNIAIRLLLRVGVPAAAVFCVILFALGFAGFADRIANATPPTNPRADAIVVLTGGTARIERALGLLAEGRASRLLISGVNPVVSPNDLAGLIGGGRSESLDLRVDVDREAIDTVGNAAETRLWATERGFSSLIVVTSNYHMPRSMTELTGAMPDMTLIPFPVSNPALRFDEWWRDPPTFALLVEEYSKYLFARARRLLPISDRFAVTTGATD